MRAQSGSLQALSFSPFMAQHFLVQSLSKSPSFFAYGLPFKHCLNDHMISCDLTPALSSAEDKACHDLLMG